MHSFAVDDQILTIDGTAGRIEVGVVNSLQARDIEYQLAPVMSSGRLIGDGGPSTPAG